MIVVDATALAAFLLREPQADAVLEHMLAHDALLAPGLLQYEIVSVIEQSRRHGRMSDDQARRAREQCGTLPWVVENHAGRDRSASLSGIAGRHGLNPYSAAYLEVARHHGCPLLTLDAALRAAAAKEGVQVLPAANRRR